MGLPWTRCEFRSLREGAEHLGTLEPEADEKLSIDSDNMLSWHGHFVNKYIVCGELVEDPMFEDKATA